MSRPTQTPRLSAAPWWTEADQAELDVLIDAFVRGYYSHQEGCAECRRSGPWCGDMREGWRLIEEWRTSRILLSQAAWLRAHQDTVDLLTHDAPFAQKGGAS